MKKKLLKLISVFFLVCCTAKQGNEHQVTIAKKLIMNIMKDAVFIQADGIDSYVAYVITYQKDTFHIEYGTKGVINDLHDSSPSVFPLDQKEAIQNLLSKENAVGEVFFSEYPNEDREQNIFAKEYFLYDSIGGMTVKIVQPKKIGDGLTGLYVPKLPDGMSFSIYALNLDAVTHNEALQMFRSIRLSKTLQ